MIQGELSQVDPTMFFFHSTTAITSIIQRIVKIRKFPKEYLKKNLIFIKSYKQTCLLSFSHFILLQKHFFY